MITLVVVETACIECRSMLIDNFDVATKLLSLFHLLDLLIQRSCFVIIYVLRDTKLTRYGSLTLILRQKISFEVFANLVVTLHHRIQTRSRI